MPGKDFEERLAAWLAEQSWDNVDELAALVSYFLKKGEVW